MKLSLTSFLITILCGSLSDDIRVDLFPEDLVLVGTDNKSIDGKTLRQYNVLFILFEEKDLAEIERKSYLQDMANPHLQIFFVTNLNRDKLLSFVSENDIPFPIFLDINGVLTNDVPYPSYKLFSKDQNRIDYFPGYPDGNRLLKHMVSSHWKESGLFVNLGSDHMVFQSYENGCGAAAVEMLLKRHGYPVDRDFIREAIDPGIDGEPVSLLKIKQFIESLGLAANGYRGNVEHLKKQTSPVLLHVDGKHYVVMSKAFESGALILDPAMGRQFWTLSRLKQRWRGIYLAIEAP